MSFTTNELRAIKTDIEHILKSCDLEHEHLLIRKSILTKTLEKCTECNSDLAYGSNIVACVNDDCKAQPVVSIILNKRLSFEKVTQLLDLIYNE